MSDYARFVIELLDGLGLGCVVKDGLAKVTLVGAGMHGGMGMRLKYSTPMFIDDVAADFPDMPIILYNVPIRTAVDVAPETVARLRRDHANIVGIKEAAGNMEQAKAICDAAPEGFRLWSGDDALRSRWPGS